MEYSAFTTKLCEVVAWPFVAVITLIVLRKPLEDFIAAWETLMGKYKEIESEFKRTLAVARRRRRMQISLRHLNQQRPLRQPLAAVYRPNQSSSVTRN
jgi:hypothetical protein